MIEQIVKPLKWGYPKTPDAGFICKTKTLFAEYEVQRDGSKFKVKYTNTAENEPAKDATGWLTEEDAKYWAYTNHCKKVLPMLDLDTLNWISVYDELPHFNQNVLAILKSGQYAVLKYMKIRDYPWLYSPPNNNEYKVQFHLDRVVQWQPLPEPPIGVPHDI